MFGANTYGSIYYGQNYPESGDVIVPVTGVAGTGAVGSLTVKATVAVSGVSASASVGSVTLQASFGITGVSGTGTVGQVTVTTTGGFITVPVTGLACLGLVGRVSVIVRTPRRAAGSMASAEASSPAPAPMILGGLRGQMAINADGHTNSMRVRHGSILTPATR